jgi:N-acetylglutamate synthase
MRAKIAAMTMDDYSEVIALWRTDEHMGRGKSDTHPAMTRFLARNPGMSFVARDRGKVVGAVLCGHDGRRGCIYHMYVAQEYRRHGIGRELVQHCLAALRREKILRCNLHVLTANEAGRRFWESLGWYWPADWGVMHREDCKAPRREG